MWPLYAEQKHRPERRAASTVAAIFVVTGVTWVLCTDAVLYGFTSDPVLIARLETAKGWVFVGLAGLLVYAVTLRSASRLARAQAIISAVIESIADGVLLLGPDRTIVHANPAAVRMLRCEHLRELVGMGAVEFGRRFRLSYPDGSLVPPDRFISQRVFDEGGPLHYKSVLHLPGGPEIVISATAAAVREEVGAPAILVVSVMHDISDSEHLERLRDRFFAAAAHALKTPVAVIKAHVQVMSRRAGPELAPSTAVIERQCGRIDRMVQNLLVLARIRSKALQLHLTEVELGPLVEQVAREMADASLQHPLRTEVGACPRVYADQERIAMVLRNLVDEAFRSSSDSPVTVIARRNGAEAKLGVRHRSLSPEERACGEYDDLGVNRCVVATIVEAHGGSLREEVAGSETIAWICLPAAGGTHERA